MTDSGVDSDDLSYADSPDLVQGHLLIPEPTSVFNACPPALQGTASNLAPLPDFSGITESMLAARPEELPALIDQVSAALAITCDTLRISECRDRAAFVEAASKLAKRVDLEVLARELVILSEYEVSLTVPRTKGGRGKKNLEMVAGVPGFTKRRLRAFREKFRDLTPSELNTLLRAARDAGIPIRRATIKKAASDLHPEGTPIRRPPNPFSSKEKEAKDGGGDSLNLAVHESWRQTAAASGLSVQDWAQQALDTAAARS